MIREAYTSTVLGPVQLGLGLLAAAATSITAASTGSPAWFTVAVAVVVALCAAHLSVVRISVGDGRVCIGQGPWNRPARAINADAVVAARSLELRWAQTLGFGVPFHRRTTRLTVRPGPALHLELDSGEHIRISTPDPDAARDLLPAARPEAS